MKFATTFYVIAVAVILLATTGIATQAMLSGYAVLGFTQAIVPLSWVAMCTAALIWSGKKLTGAARPGGQTFFATLSFAGVVCGSLVGALASMGQSYGVREAGVAINYLSFFAIGAAIAIFLATLLAGFASAFFVITRRLHNA